MSNILVIYGLRKKDLAVVYHGYNHGGVQGIIIKLYF